LYYLVGNIEDARDALQEAFVKCWRSHEKLVEVQNLKAWIFRIALNTGLTEPQLRDLITHLHACIGPDRSDRAAAILDQVLATR